MTLARKLVGRTFRLALGAAIFSGCFATQQARAQAPYLLPYTIQSLGGTTAPAINSTCVGTNGVVGTAYDALGDGCPLSSGSVIIGSSADLHDVGVDAQGNIYFLDSSSTNGFVRRIDARSGIVTAYAGTASATQPTVNCGLPTPTQDKYGDGCQANDGKGNVPPVAAPGTTTVPPYMYTANLARARGISVSRNGDVYIAGYNSYVVQKISLATGTLNLVAGQLAGGTAAAPKGYIGQSGYTGDGGTAAGISGAKVNAPRGVVADAAGNVYFADSGNNVVRKVTFATGIISTVVGVYPGSSVAATSGFGGDGGPATAALLATPEDVEIDALGNLFIGDFGNNRVRVVYAGGAAVAKLIALTNAGATATVGNIYTIIGGGAGSYAAGTIVPSTSVPIGNPRKIALDARGNIYVADNSFNVIWFLDATTGFMRVLAGQYGKTTGTGTLCNSTAFGDGCPATQATFTPTGGNGASLSVAVDSQGNVLVGDSGDKELRRANTNQIFAATANGATLSQILFVHFAAADAPAAVTPFAITGSTDFTITNTACTVNADTTQDCLLTVAYAPTRPGVQNANLVVKSTLNGNSTLGITGTGAAASVALDPGATSSYAAGLNNPQAIAQDAAGVTYIADTANNRVLRQTGAGAFTVFAGTGVAGNSGDNGAATAATLNGPQGVAVARDGSILISDTGNNTIRLVSPSTGIITTYAGGATTVCASAVDTLGDGCPLRSAAFLKPTGLAADPDGNVYVSDTGNNVIRELTVGGYAVYVAGGATTVCGSDPYGNGCAPNATIFVGPTGLAVDANRNVYVADTGNNEVRKIGAGGIITLVAGTGANGASGNGGPATGAQLSSPTGVAVDAGSNVYIADTGNSVVRLVTALGTINTTIGTLSASGTGTLPGSAFAVQLASPSALVSNGAGRLIVLDAGNNRAIADDRGSVNFTFNRTPPGTTSAALQIQETVTGSTAAILGTPLFTTTGTPAAFSLTGTTSNGCSGSTTPLAPGTACLLSATFTPPALGNYTATFTESATNTINAPVPFVTLSGTGAVLTKTTSATTLTGTATYAVPFTVTTVVTPASCNTAAPACSATGTVTYFVDGTQVGLAQNVPANGTTSIAISGLSVGAHNVVAVYSGDGFYAGSTAPTLVVTIAPGITKTVVSATPATGVQFSDLTLTATVNGPIATSFPTGSVSFYAGTTLLGTSILNGKSGTVTLADKFIAAVGSTPAHFPQSFGLPAGTYNLTAVYSGDANYSTSTSAGTPLVISPQPTTYTLSVPAPAATGTAQGSTGQLFLFIQPTNTFNGTLTFACSGMPASSSCTFGPTSLTFAPVAGPASQQSTQITLFTDVPPSAVAKNVSPDLKGRNFGGSALAGMLGWPVLLLSLVGMLGFRKQLRKTRLLAALALFGLLAGGSVVLTGCDNVDHSVNLTPVGVYKVTVTATGGNGSSQSIPITFTVTAGEPGQL